MEVDYYGYKHTLILRYNYFNEFCHCEIFCVVTFHAGSSSNSGIHSIANISHEVSFFKREEKALGFSGIQ